MGEMGRLSGRVGLKVMGSLRWEGVGKMGKLGGSGVGVNEVGVKWRKWKIWGTRQIEVVGIGGGDMGGWGIGAG